MLSLVFALSILVSATPASAQTPGPPKVDPCTLVPRADVEPIVGKLSAAPKSQVVEQVRTCEYAFVDSNLSLEIWVFPASSLERVRNQFKDLTPATDLGAPAVQRREKTIDWLELYSRKGDVTFEVTMKSGAGDLEKAKELARKVLAGFPLHASASTIQDLDLRSNCQDKRDPC
jgi:hypothetical protein